MQSQFNYVADLIRGLNYFEQQKEKVSIIIDKDGHEEEIDWQLGRAKQSLRTFLGKIWFINDPNTFNNLDILLSKLKRAEYDNEIKRLKVSIQGGTITIQVPKDIKKCWEAMEKVRVYMERELDKILRQHLQREELIESNVFVKRPAKRALEVTQLSLVEHLNKEDPFTNILKIAVTCEGIGREFVYDENYNPNTPLSGIAKQIIESTGIDFQSVNEPEGVYVVQTTYPSIKNLLSYYLVKGGWITAKEVSQIEVIGYPSKEIDLTDVLGLQVGNDV